MKKIIIIASLLAVCTFSLIGCTTTKEPAKQISENTVYEYEEQEIICSYDGKDIYGIACIPVNAGDKMPTVIFSHGFSGTLEGDDVNAHELASKGIASYRFDFYGGSARTKSGGKMNEMSIFTEKSDLEAVIKKVKKLDFVDEDNIYLFGTSQGGAVSAITANDLKDEIKGMILLYPALCIPDDAREKYSSVDEIPESVRFMGADLGKIYYENILDYDIYEKIDNYKNDVLIFHGDNDGLVDISYSKKAIEVYKSAELVVFEGAGHGNLSDEYKAELINKTIEFILN